MERGIEQKGIKGAVKEQNITKWTTKEHKLSPPASIETKTQAEHKITYSELQSGHLTNASTQTINALRYPALCCVHQGTCTGTGRSGGFILKNTNRKSGITLPIRVVSPVHLCIGAVKLERERNSTR